MSLPSRIRKNCCTDLLLLTSRKKSVTKKGKSNTSVSLEKFQSLSGNRTDHPPCSSTDALTTDLLEDLRREGSEINCYYTSHTGPVTGTYWTSLRKKKCKGNVKKEKIPPPITFKKEQTNKDNNQNQNKPNPWSLVWCWASKMPRLTGLLTLNFDMFHQTDFGGSLVCCKKSHLYFNGVENNSVAISLMFSLKHA